MSRGAPTNSRSSMKQKMDRMDPIIRDFGRPERKNTEGLLSLKATFKLAQMVVLAFRGPRAVGPRMLGVKQNTNKDGYAKNSLKPSWSAVDLSDEGESLNLANTYQEKLLIFCPVLRWIFLLQTRILKGSFKYQVGSCQFFHF